MRLRRTFLTWIYMRILLAALACIVLAAGSAAAQPAPARADSARYMALVQRLQGGDTLIDFTALRFTFAKLESPGERHPDPEAEYRAAERAPDDETARRLHDALLADYYGSVNAHMGAVRLFETRGDSSRAAFHAAVVRGFIRSMEASMDADSVIPVISIGEEYAFMRSRGLQVTGQALTTCGSHMCDVLSAKDEGTKKTVSYSFRLTWWPRDEEKP